MLVLVTGTTGFIVRHRVQALVRPTSDRTALENRPTGAYERTKCEGEKAAFAAKIAALGAEITGKVLSREPKFTRYQVDFFARTHASDISKAQQMLGYQPKVELPEGIMRMVGWYRERGLI